MVKHFNIWLYTIGVVSVISMIISLFILFLEKEEEIKDWIISDKLNSIEMQNDKIATWLNQVCKDEDSIQKCILNNPLKSDTLNNLLSISMNQDIRYTFLVFKDEKERYRFIGDGAESPARTMQKIDTDNKEVWNEVYLTAEHRIISASTHSDGLWLTYLSPFVKEGKTYMMLVTDFSISLDDNIKAMLLPVKQILIYILSITIIIFVIGIVQMLMYLHAKKDSYIDELTGLLNRNYLRKFVEDGFKHSKYVIAIVDLDYFKKINDQYGHDVGDIVLKEAAAIFQKVSNKKNFVIRYGGEEFLFLIEKKDYENVLNNLITEIREHTIELYDNRINFTVSIGVNIDLHRNKHFTDMVKSADIALYNAKMNGRDQIVYYSETIKDEQKSNFQVIQSAIDNNRVFCEYQAIINVSSNTVFKYEALVRIIDDNANVVYPNAFIEIIKNTNIYTDLTKRVIDITTKKFLDLNSHKFSINLGLQDFNNKDIVNYILEMIEQHPKLLDLMSIEVLEYDKVDNEKSCIEVIKLLQSHGLKIALDDFGSGYANFSTILNYDFDSIKIDGSIIQKIIEDEKAINIVQAIVDFAESHNIIVICEFVSSQTIYDLLKSSSIEYMQGFHLSKPNKELLPYVK